MDAAQLLREARWSSGLSQRALAERAGISRRVVESAESGRTAPRADVLDALLRACGRQLESRPAPATGVDEQALRAHLRLSLTRRLHLAAGGAPGARTMLGGTPVWSALCRLALAEWRIAVFAGPLALAAWVPGQQVIAGQPVVVSSFRLGALARSSPLALDVVSAPWTTELVPVRLPGGGGRLGGDVLVPPPFTLADRAEGDLAAALACVARLLHREGGRDVAGRRVPAHVRPDESAQASDVRSRYDSRTGPMPSVLDSRTWRLDVPATLRADIEERGLVRYPPKPGWSRWGWR